MKTLSTQIIICFFTFFICISNSHAQQFNWVTGGGTTTDFSGSLSSLSERVEFMCADQNGNIYAVSQVGNNPITADTFSGLAYGSYQNILITSYTCSGQMRWAKLIASSGGTCQPYTLVADNMGHIYVAGYMNTATLHIGFDTSISGLVYEDEGLIQLDTSGHFNWIRFVGNNTLATFDGSVVYGSSAAVDSANNIHFFNSMKYGVPITSSLTSHYGTYDLMYNPSGALMSVKQLQLDSTLIPVGVTIDKQNNNAYAYGCRIAYDWTFEGGDSSAYNFLAAFDTGRNRIWIDTIGDPPAVNEGIFSGIAADGAGHLYLCGGGNGYLVYQGYTIAPPVGAVGGYISFIMKTDTAGNKEWVKQCNGHNDVGYGAITLMPGNKVAAAGTFVGPANSGAININSSNYDPYFTVLDTAGTLITLQRINGDGYQNEGGAIVSDNVGNLYIGGEVADSIPDTLIPAYHSVGGNTDFFVLKYGVDCSCTSMPVASYTSTGTSTVSVTYTGTTAGLDSVVWNFDDGTTALGITATHAYTVVGSVDLCVTVYTGCGFDVYCDSLTVNCTGTPVSSYTDTGAAVIGFTYTGTTTGLDSVAWNYGDGHTGTGITPTHTYSASGTYTVCATVYTGCGSDTYCNSIVVNCTPTASFSDTGTTTRGFTYTGTTISLDSVAWNFGDGTSALGTTSIHTYSASGTYTVCATVYAACGSNTACSTVVISCTPVSSFTSSGTSSVNFVYTGTTAGLDSVVWNFGDGSAATGAAPSHTYSVSGTYTVCATVYATCGNNTYCSSIVVDCSPTASFSDTGTVTRGFTYTGTTTGIDSVVWNFGDGGSATGITSTHTYAATGTYTVCVTAYTTCGNATSCSEVTIICIASPIASFTYTGIDTVNFTYTGTTTEIDSVVWSFGDGSTDTGITIIHPYTDTGTYTVCVTVYTNCGSDSSCSVVVVSSTGISKLSISTIQVFPNPTTDALNITGIQQNTSYRLLNVTGECVQQGDLKPGSNMVSMQNISPNVYVLEMTGEDGQRNIVQVVKE